MVPASVNEKYVIRFCAVAQNSSEDDIGNEHMHIFYTIFWKKKKNIFTQT